MNLFPSLLQYNTVMKIRGVIGRRNTPPRLIIKTDRDIPRGQDEWNSPAALMKQRQEKFARLLRINNRFARLLKRRRSERDKKH